MAFVRSKTVKGKRYLYRVESYRDHGKVRQRVLEYIGRAEPATRQKKKPKKRPLKITKKPKVRGRGRARPSRGAKK